MKAKIRTYGAHFQVCQQNKVETLQPAGLLQPIPIPTRIWEDISVDFVEGLSLSYEYTCILVMVNRFNKYAHFVGVKTHLSLNTLSRFLSKNISGYMKFWPLSYLI